MGYGDDIMATGLARGLADKGKLAAFGDGKRIIWGPWSEEMFLNNRNIAKPGSENSIFNLEWIPHYKGSRMYNKSAGGKWVWNYKFKVTPGEFFFTESEKALARSFHSIKDFVVMEPNVPWQKKVATNKDWGGENYEIVSEHLYKMGYKIVQFIHKNSKRKLPRATHLEFSSFRDCIAILSNAGLYIGPEGGMHHAAAAVGVKGVVIFGGFIPPSVTGYDNHVNLTGLTGGVKACGNIEPCIHCRKAMKNITVDQVTEEASHVLAAEAA